MLLTRETYARQSVSPLWRTSQLCRSFARHPAEAVRIKVNPVGQIRLDNAFGCDVAVEPIRGILD